MSMYSGNTPVAFSSLGKSSSYFKHSERNNQMVYNLQINHDWK
jgi:hypothetical protein